MNWLRDRLSEKSTWLGLFAMASAFGGITFLPEQKDAIQLLVFALLSTGHIVSKEHGDN